MYYTVKPLQNLKSANDNICPMGALTADELLIIRRMMTGEHVTYDNSGLEEKDWSRLMKNLGR
jgi:hypothetical protein